MRDIGKFKDLSGEMVNNWLVISHEGFTRHGASLWNVECQCDKKTRRIKSISHLKQRKSCGCKNVKNLRGHKYNRLLVVSDILYKNNRIYYYCDCDCGKKNVLVRSDGLTRGTTKSCGCYRKEITTKTGCSRERLYGIWGGMLNRCEDKSNKRYSNYGGRGISVCNEWKKDYLSFKSWAYKNGYEEGLTIERVNVNGNYEPRNCSWLTMSDQARNKTNTIYFTLDDTNVYKLIDLSESSGLNRDTILKRYKSGIRNKDLLLYDGSLQNKSGIIGVSYSNNQKNWRAFININKKRIELGRRKDKVEAIELRLNAELKYLGKDLSPQKDLFEMYSIGGVSDEI